MVVIAASLVFATIASATITDDIDPQDRRVHVSLSNPDPVRGSVTVVADLGGGKTASVVLPFDIGPGGTTTVTAVFDSTVVRVTDVSIIENPDPIPSG